MAQTGVYIQLKNTCGNFSYLQSQESESSTFYVHDDKEDVCTQTENLTSTSSLQGTAHKWTKNSESGFIAPEKYRRGSYFGRNKTLSNIKFLREKHRENERLRHHSLNQHLRLICKKVPGSAEDGKETKVVMMQRIISYIAFLENTVKFLSSQLKIRPDPSWLLLTSSVKDIERSDLWEISFQSSDDSQDAEKFARNLSSRLTLSSPALMLTANSTIFEPPLNSEPFEEKSQDSVLTCSEIYADMEESCTSFDNWVVPDKENVLRKSDGLKTYFETSDCEHTKIEFPLHFLETKLSDSSEEVKWLGSPDRNCVLSQDLFDSQFGIKCDYSNLEDQFPDISHTVVVSPNLVLPQMTFEGMSTANISHTIRWDSGQQLTSQSNDNTMTLCRNSKRKQLSPRRTPLYDMCNWLDLSRGGQTDLLETEQGNVWGFASNEDNSSKLSIVIKKEIKEVENSEIPESQMLTVSGNTSNVETVTRKLDLRKSSWMNGFMMYSRLHRKHYIKENPGMQASSISKLMGQKWRGMNEEQQKPYRDKAKICSQRLQKMLDDSCNV